MKSFYLAALFFFTSYYKPQAQSIIAQQLTNTPSWYLSLENYMDPFFGFPSYQSVGQTFKSLQTTTISTIDFNMLFVNTPSTVTMEIYSCPNATSWGSLLGTKTGIALNSSGWVSVDVSSLNITVTTGSYYGFKLLPQNPLQAGIAVTGDVYSDGVAWANGALSNDYPFKISGLVVLPVNLLSFMATMQKDKVSLQWQTASEENSKNFLLQHSTDGNNWNTIATLVAAGYSKQTREYSYVDNNPVQGINYYRLEQIDLDGKSNLSPTRMIKIEAQKNKLVLVNPVRNRVLEIQNNRPSTLALYTEDGRLIWKKWLNAGKQNIELRGISNGIYYLQGNNSADRVLIE
jgi:hypothetical protein